MALHSLKLSDYSDVELLAIVNDVANDDGWASTHDLAEQLGIESERPSKHVGSRFAWMRRWGWIERDFTDGQSHWRLTAVGQTLISGQMNRTVRTALDRLKPGERVKVTRHLAQAAQKSGQPARTMLRREWRRNTE